MTRTRTLANCLAQINSATERMIAVQMLAYPNDWPEADKREVAMLHLFGRKEMNP